MSHLPPDMQFVLL